MPVAARIAAIWAPISSVALAVWPARLFTSPATTAKPLPASPARAASIVALSARRLVCSAICWMMSTTLPMRAAVSSSDSTIWLVEAAWRSASLAISPERPIMVATVRIEENISSVAAATERTLPLACSDAFATTAERSLASTARRAISSAERSSVSAATATAPTTLPTRSSKSRARRSVMRRRSSSRALRCCSSRATRATASPSVISRI